LPKAAESMGMRHKTELTEAQVIAFMRDLSNWGRWGADDELGTLNLITPSKRISAADEVVEGISIGCARPIVKEGPVADVIQPPLHHMLLSGEAADADHSSDFLAIAPHGVTVTHVDAIAHMFWEGKLYNGRPKSLVTTAEGATVCSVDTMKEGIVTRGVMLDIARLRDKPFLEAGEAIFQEDLVNAERQERVSVGSGDALLIRTGWSRRRNEKGPYAERMHRPGLHASTLPWLRERDVALVAADVSIDVYPSGYQRPMLPVHWVGIVAMGLCLIDACQFEDLSATCERLGRWSFMFVTAPLRWQHATASPVTPLAIF
jgi:kynurenine formamidase